MTVLGVLHPGEMGAALGSALTERHVVVWASETRSADTMRRAEAAGMRDVVSLPELLAESEIVISICPPHAALDVVDSVAGYGGIFVDANAIAPATADEVRERAERGGAIYVDGAIIGPPPRQAGTTRLYLSGSAAPTVAATFRGSRCEPVTLEGPVNAASALKMSYAAWTKGSMALMLAARSLASALGVEEALVAEWELSQGANGERSRVAASMASRKGWRFVGEMEEIAEAMAASGLPAGFHEAAAELYSRVPREPDASPDDARVAAVVRSVLDGGRTAAT